jgi:hypothetical protein
MQLQRLGGVLQGFLDVFGRRHTAGHVWKVAGTILPGSFDDEQVLKGFHGG